MLDRYSPDGNDRFDGCKKGTVKGPHIWRALTRLSAPTRAGQLHVQALDTAWRGSERGGHRESVLQISLGCLMVYKYRTSDSGDEFLSC